jgi:hypothetical protein
MLRAVALALLLALPAATGQAQAPRPQSWPEVKCSRYAEAWAEALDRFGRRGLGPDFVARHEAFLASGCSRARADVCPRSPEELALADVLAVAATNSRMAGSFLPFACRDALSSGAAAAPPTGP